jgi:prepilin-type N-terminal cleavage/methylation domain-containing protein
MKRRDAFTLTELLVTVAVGSLLAVAILPILQRE